MPTYEITAPDGTKYEVTGPGTEQEALAQVQAQQSQPAAPVQSPAGKEFSDFASGATQNPARGQYEALGTMEALPVAAVDVVNLMANGATFGFADKVAARARSMATGKPYEEELAEQRRQTEGSRNRARGAGVAAELTGALSTPLSVAQKGITLAGRGGTAAMTGAKGLLARTGLMGAEGAGYGALTAAGNDQDIGTGAALGAAGGAAGNVVGEGISAGVGKVAGMLNKAPVRTTAAKLNANKTAAYDLSEKAGVIIKPQGIDDVTNKIKADMAEFSYHPKRQPGAETILEDLEAVRGQNVTLKGLDTIRKGASDAYIPGNKSNNALVRKIVDRIDELIDSQNPEHMAGLNTEVGAKSIKIAREFAHRARKLETVEYQLNKGRLQGLSNKSQNVEQRGKKQILSIIGNEAKARGFKPAEKAAAEKAVGYSAGERVLDATSGLFPSGKMGAMMQMVAAPGAFAALGPAGLAIQGAGMVAGYGAKKWADKLARANVDEFVDLVSRGGIPAPVVKNALQLLAKSKRDAITRSLMALSANRAQAPAQQ